MLSFHRPGPVRPWRFRPRANAARHVHSAWIGAFTLSGFWAACLLATSSVVAQEGGSHRAWRDEAARAIPFQQLTPAAQNKVWEVVANPSLYRRMPSKAITCDPELYLFLLRHPEVVVNIWDLMGITQVSMARIGPDSVQAADGGGTHCVAHTLYRSRETHVLYAEGFYEGNLLKNRLTGTCVLLLRSAYAPGQGDEMVITTHLDVFVKVDNAGVDLLAKTLSPLMGKSADSNFVESAAFLGKLSQAAEQNGPGVQRLAEQLVAVDPAVRRQFGELATAISHRAALRAVDPLAMEESASQVVQRAIDQGVTPFGQPLEEPFSPTTPAAPEPPRRGITLRR